MRRRQARIVLDVAPAHHGAERNAVVGNPDVAQLSQLAQVDQKARRREPEGEHRHQALPAGQRFRIAIARGQERHRFGERRRTGIFEGRHFHLILGPFD